jgi:prepilin-type N-terminal cleavage/methylation domain-containing protein
MRREIKGFTLVEMLVVLGLMLGFGIVALTFSVPQLQASQTESLLDDIRSLTFLQQQKAYSGLNSKAYGIYFDTNSYTVFTGTSYAGRESGDQLMFPADTTITEINFGDANQELVFSQGSLKPSTSGYVRFSNEIDTFILEINSEGLLYTYKE